MIGVEAFEIWRKNGLPLELVPCQKKCQMKWTQLKIEQ